MPTLNITHDAQVTVSIRQGFGDPVVFAATISGEALRRMAYDAPMPYAGALVSDDYERRMMRRALIPLVSRAVEGTLRQAAWHAISKWLDLDPEKGF